MARLRNSNMTENNLVLLKKQLNSRVRAILSDLSDFSLKTADKTNDCWNINIDATFNNGKTKPFNLTVNADNEITSFSSPKPQTALAAV